jgi:hypothetical protein
MASPAVGETANPKMPTKLARKGQDTAEAAKDDDTVATQVKGKPEDAGQEAASKVEKKDSFDLARADPEPIKDEDDAGAQDGSGADEGTGKSGFVHVSDHSNGQDEQEYDGVMSGVRQASSSPVGDAKKAAGHVTGAVKRAADGDTSGAAGKANDIAKDATDGAKDAAKGTTGVDLSILDGLEVADDGLLYDGDDAIGRLAEGDAEDLVGYTVSGKGEILDDDGDLVGLVEIIPEKEKELLQKAKDAAGIVPGLELLNGLTTDQTGLIYNDDGDVVGQVAEGNPSDLKGLKLNEKGEFVRNGKVLGKAQIHPEYLDQAQAAAEAQGEAGEAIDEAGEGQEAAEAAGEHVDEAAEELPGIEALEGKDIGSDGMVRDEEGNVLGEVAEGDAKEMKGMSINKAGEVVDSKGNVIGKVQMASQELLYGSVPDLRILENLKVNKKGKILDSEGDVIGELIDGESSQCAGKKVNARGEVMDGETVIGHVKVVPGDAANEAMKELEQQLGGLPHAGEEEATDDGLRPLSILEGLKCNKAGKLINDKNQIVGELVEGDAKKIARSGASCDEQGKFWDSKGHCVGRAQTVKVQDEEEDGAFAGLEGLIVAKGGLVHDENGNVVGKIVEGEANKLVGRAVDEDGDIVDRKGSVIGRAERYEVPEEEQQAPADLSALEGTTINKRGFAVDHTGRVVGQVSEGDVKKLVGCKVDGQGQVWNSSGKIVGKCELAEDHNNSDDGPFGGFEDNRVAKDGTVQSADGSVIGRVVEGDVKRLAGYSVDADGEITDRNGNVIGRAERWEPEEMERKKSPMSGFKVNKEGEVRGSDGEVLGRLTSGDLGRCIGLEIDDNGNAVDQDGNMVGTATLVENIGDEEPEDADEEQRKEVANKMANICQQTLERIQPVMKQIQEASFPAIREHPLTLSAHGQGRPHAQGRARRGGARQPRQAADRGGPPHPQRVQRQPARPRPGRLRRRARKGPGGHEGGHARRVPPGRPAQGADADGRQDHRRRQEEAQRHAAREEEAEPPVGPSHGAALPGNSLPHLAVPAIDTSRSWRRLAFSCRAFSGSSAACSARSASAGSSTGCSAGSASTSCWAGWGLGACSGRRMRRRRRATRRPTYRL